MYASTVTAAARAVQGGSNLDLNPVQGGNAGGAVSAPISKEDLARIKMWLDDWCPPARPDEIYENAAGEQFLRVTPVDHARSIVRKDIEAQAERGARNIRVNYDGPLPHMPEGFTLERVVGLDQGESVLAAGDTKAPYHAAVLHRDVKSAEGQAIFQSFRGIHALWFSPLDAPEFPSKIQSQIDQIFSLNPENLSAEEADGEKAALLSELYDRLEALGAFAKVGGSAHMVAAFGKLSEVVSGSEQVKAFFSDRHLPAVGHYFPSSKVLPLLKLEQYRSRHGNTPESWAAMAKLAVDMIRGDKSLVPTEKEYKLKGLVTCLDVMQSIASAQARDAATWVVAKAILEVEVERRKLFEDKSHEGKA